MNTCSIREKAEQRRPPSPQQFRQRKEAQEPGALVGVLGCMAERLKSKLLEEERLVDMVVGPDAYRTPARADGRSGRRPESRERAAEPRGNLCRISPVRLNSNGVTAFITIMRGCNNMCSFCVVPFTRGRERSRDAQSIVAEAQDLFGKGYREVTLLGPECGQLSLDG